MLNSSAGAGGAGAGAGLGAGAVEPCCCADAPLAPSNESNTAIARHLLKLMSARMKQGFGSRICLSSAAERPGRARRLAPKARRPAARLSPRVKMAVVFIMSASRPERSRLPADVESPLVLKLSVPTVGLASDPFKRRPPLQACANPNRRPGDADVGGGKRLALLRKATAPCGPSTYLDTISFQPSVLPGGAVPGRAAGHGCASRRSHRRLSVPCQTSFPCCLGAIARRTSESSPLEHFVRSSLVSCLRSSLANFPGAPRTARREAATKAGRW